VVGDTTTGLDRSSAVLSTGDARIAPVEGNLVRFLTRVGGDPLFSLLPDDDVTAFTSDVPFHLFNCVTDARFAEATRASRTAEVADRMIEHGLPWLWWGTPSGLPDDAVLRERGLARGDEPGMYVALDGPVDPRSGLRMEPVTTDRLEWFLDVFGRGFGLPDFVVTAMDGVFTRTLDPAWIVNLLAWDGDVAVGCGSAVVDGATVGLYNIATPAEHRGRGIGYAVTATLMNHGRERGCVHAILHASAMGRPVYERLGFEQVCTVPQYVWQPPSRS
jgi:GNAT superfamily N-acetyltransferase